MGTSSISRFSLSGAYKEIRSVDPSDFHGENEVDSPVPLEHEICVMHLSLPALSSLLSEDIQWGSEAYYTRCNDLPSPFQWAARLNSREPIRCPTFETIKSRPWLVAIVGKERVVWKDLENGSVRWMRVPRWDRHPHFVRLSLLPPLPLSERSVRCNPSESSNTSLP